MQLAYKPGVVRTVLTLLSACFAASAQADRTDAAYDRCVNEVGEFGNAMVQNCIEYEIAAARALESYPPAAKEAIAWCSGRLQARGWQMVQVCVDNEMHAADALEKYGAEHDALIDRCQQQLAQ